VLCAQYSDVASRWALRSQSNHWPVGGIATEVSKARCWLRAFELMETYADRLMDLADASLIVAAEELKTCRVFTVDRDDFQTYRVRRGHRHLPVRIIG